MTDDQARAAIKTTMNQYLELCSHGFGSSRDADFSEWRDPAPRATDPTQCGIATAGGAA